MPPSKRPGRAVATLLSALLVTACESLVDKFDASLNPIGEPNPPVTETAKAFHDSLLVADLHADTLMWPRGLEGKAGLGQLDLARLARGNVGLQVLTMPTRVPEPSDVWQCTHARGFDPAPWLAMASGWPAPSWSSPYQRALVEAKALQRALAGSNARQVRTIADLEAWLNERFATQPQDRSKIAFILGVEGAHAFATDLGPQFASLVDDHGLRLVGPTHHFTNAYGGSSEGCERPLSGLTEDGKRLVRTLFARNMILDLAHSSSAALADGVELALQAGRPVLVSHTGIRNYLAAHPFMGVDESRRTQGINRATPQEDVLKVASTGGSVGVIYWEEQIGGATVENVGGSILQAYCDLAKSEGTQPDPRGHAIVDASEHVSLGSDWDGAAKNAVDAAHVDAITARLKALGLTDLEVANIAGRNACRAIAQNLSGGAYDFAAAKKLCSGPGPQAPPERPADRRARQAKLCAVPAART